MEQDLDLTAVELPKPSAPEPSGSTTRAQVIMGNVPGVGQRMGRYIVLAELGAGAMGVVLAAYDPELDRKAALKLLKSAGRLATGRERLRREAQALARLNHVNVVTVYDVGVHESQVFVAMEFVHGQTLRAWMDDAEGMTRPWREVLRVLMAAGRGLAAAHGVGLVHRDFKPDNVMIGDDGRVRVMDFGLARFGESGSIDTDPDAHANANAIIPEARSAPSSSTSLKLTQTGAQVGTPAYMAPEQFKGKPAGAASDQFAFCASLYEGLYGRRPFMSDSLENLMTAVVAGNLLPPPPSSPVPGWIAKVVTRGLAVDPLERYPSMDALLAALDSDPRQRYRRVGVGAAMTAALAGAVWLGGTLSRDAEDNGPIPCTNMQTELAGIWDAARRVELATAFAGTELSYAAPTWDRVERGLDDYTAAWIEARVGACEATQAGTQSGELLDRKMSCLDERLARVAALVDELAGAETATVDQATQAVAELPSLAPCADTRTLLAERPASPDDPEVAARVEALGPGLRLVQAKSSLADYDQALTLADTLVVEAAAIGHEPAQVGIGLAQSSLRINLGHYEDAHATLEQVYAIALRYRMWQEAFDAASQLMGLTSRELVRPPEAQRWAALADALHRMVGTDAARERHLAHYGQHLAALGHYKEARDVLDQALEAVERSVGPEHIRVAGLLGALGAVYLNEGNYERARPLLERALEIKREALGSGHPDIASMLANLGIIAFRTGDYARARADFEQARAIFERAMGPDSYKVSRVLDSLGSVALLDGDYPSARDYYGRAQAIIERTIGSENPQIAALTANLGEVARNEGKFDEACAKQERARELFEATHGPEHPALILVQTELGKARLGLGETDQAIVELERALALSAQFGGDPLALADLQFTLAGALSSDLPRARELARLAREVYANAGSIDEIAKIDAWLDAR